MKFSEDSGQAANYLRQAIPTMIKHNIVPNPLNYTLWYSYFSNDFPELNKQLDQTIERYGTCPSKVGESLFIQYVSQLDDDKTAELENFQNAFSHLVNNLNDSMDSTSKQTSGYSTALKNNISVLESCELDDSVKPILDELNANANALSAAHEKFQSDLSVAQSEINLLKNELEESQRDANTDPLTGLFNRRVFESIFDQFEEERSEHDSIALIIMDIDKFKLFNDTHGHLLGDQVLKFVGELLKSECPDSIVPVRFGGEEFAMLCPNYDMQKAFDVAEKIRSKLASLPFNSKKTNKLIPPITASFGVASKNSNEVLSQIVERADKALYAAKEAGRNQVHLADINSKI